MPTMLDEKQVAELTEGLQTANQALEDTRKEMDKSNTQVAELLAKQKTLDATSTTGANEIEDLNKRLQDQANRMDTIAKQHTELVHITRTQSRMVGASTSNSNDAYVYRHPNSKGTIFKCKEQAKQIGMYFMATMAKEGPCKANARRWLKERAGDLQFLPNLSPRLIQDLGNEWTATVTKLQTIDRDIVSQDLGGHTTPGAVLVFPEFSATLIRNVEEHGVFRREALIWPMGSDIVHIPRRKAGVSVVWEGEAEAGTETDPSFQLVAITAKKMMMLHQFSSELNEDAAISLADILVFEFALAIALEEDRIGFNGTGTGGNSPGFAGYVGVLGADANATEATADSTFVPQLVTAATSDDTTPEVTEAKLREMTGRVHTWARNNAKWYMNRTVHADFDGIQQGTAGGSVVQYQDPRSATIMGFPIVDVEQMPVSPSSASTHVIALGDLRRSWILGDRRAPEVQTSEHYAFNTDQLTMRVRARIAFLMQSGNGMVVLKLAA